MKRKQELQNLSNKNLKAMDKELFKFYKKTLRELKKEVKEYMKEYESLTFSQQMSVNRKRELLNKVEDILSKTSKEEQLSIRNFLKREAKDGYLGVFYDLESKLSVGIEFAMINEKYIEALVNKKIKGKTFSKRLYKNREKIARSIKSELQNDAILGKGYRYVAKGLSEKTEANYRQSLRIARTEGHRVQTEATQRGYEEAEELGIDMKKKWMSTLDDRTRDTHAHLDGQIVNVDETFISNGYEAYGPGMFGVAEEDIHCRCTTVSVVNGISPNLRRDNTNDEVIEYVNYNEWRKRKEF